MTKRTLEQFVAKHRKVTDAACELLSQLEYEARASFSEGANKTFSPAIWKKHDPELFKYVDKLSKAMKGELS